MFRVTSGRPSATTGLASAPPPTRRITSGVRVSALSGATETGRTWARGGSGGAMTGGGPPPLAGAPVGGGVRWWLLYA